MHISRANVICLMGHYKSGGKDVSAPFTCRQNDSIEQRFVERIAWYVRNDHSDVLPSKSEAKNPRACKKRKSNVFWIRKFLPGHRCPFLVKRASLDFVVRPMTEFGAVCINYIQFYYSRPNAVCVLRLSYCGV